MCLLSSCVIILQTLKGNSSIFSLLKNVQNLSEMVFISVSHSIHNLSTSSGVCPFDIFSRNVAFEGMIITATLKALRIKAL